MRTRIAIGTVLAAVFGLLTLIPLVADPRPQPREIVLVARDMAFFVDGAGAANPTLKVHAGEQIKVVLRNEEDGVIHDFAVRDLKVATDRLHGVGTASVTFRAPDKPGTYPYVCNPHSAMMRGTFEVE